MIRRLAMGVAIMFACMISTSPAFAHRHHKTTNVIYSEGKIVSHPAGCPRIAFCGCGASVRIFGHPVRNLYRAAAWFKFRKANPAPGMVAVRNHHVMVILAYDGNGNATVYDANSGHHQTRIHVRSLDGYKIVNPNGYFRYAAKAGES